MAPPTADPVWFVEDTSWLEVGPDVRPVVTADASVAVGDGDLEIVEWVAETRLTSVVAPLTSQTPFFALQQVS